MAVVAQTLVKYSSGEWTYKQSTAFLNVHGLNTETIVYVLTSIDDGGEWKYPVTWSQVEDFRQLIDVIMHQLGLGIAKVVHNDLIIDWLIQRRVLASFSCSNVGKLDTVKSLYLAWCKPLPTGSTGNLGGWVSENHFAWAIRIARWYFANISDLVEDAPYVQLNKPVNQWTIIELKEWLHSHQIPQGDTKRVSELQAKVGQLFSLPGGLPPAVSPKGGPASKMEELLLPM